MINLPQLVLFLSRTHVSHHARMNNLSYSRLKARLTSTSITWKAQMEAYQNQTTLLDRLVGEN